MWGGGSLTETTLWTNSNPSATSFATQTVNLSDSISNYKYIKIVACYTRLDTSITCELLIKSSDFPNYTYATSHMSPAISLKGSSNSYYRYVAYATDTSIAFGDCTIVGKTTKENGNAVPLTIIGLK